MAEEYKSSRISHHSYSTLLWNYLGSAIRMTSQFLIGIVLARLLGPEVFGIVAIGWLLAGIGNLMADKVYSGELANTDNIMNNTFWIGVYPGLTEAMLDYVAGQKESFFGVNF
jgi:hypothetical protein